MSIEKKDDFKKIESDVDEVVSPGENQEADMDSGDKNDHKETEEERRQHLYENYIIDDPEDMDEAPDTGDMFDDDELYGDDYYDDMPDNTAHGKKSRHNNHSGIIGTALIMLWILFVTLLGVYIYCFFINKNLFNEDVNGRDNSVLMDIPENSIYSLCTADEIKQLINNYLLARTKADQSTLQRLVTDPSEFDDMTSIEIAAKYITAYNRTTCYVAAGYTTDSYIIYELSNLTIKDVESSPLDIRSFYVTRLQDGSYRINNSQLSSEEKAYIDSVTASKDVQDIYRHVKENNDYLLNNDETLKEFESMYTDKL